MVEHWSRKPGVVSSNLTGGNSESNSKFCSYLRLVLFPAVEDKLFPGLIVAWSQCGSRAGWRLNNPGWRAGSTWSWSCWVKLHVANFNGFDILSHWSPIYRSRFSTPDADNDKHENRHCAKEYKSGWWFDDCGESNLNGPYPKYRQPMTWSNIYWGNWRKVNENETALRFVSMNLYHSKP